MPPSPAPAPQGPRPSGFMGTLEYYFGQKAPQLPAGFKEWLVKFGPWIELILLILAAPMILGLLGLNVGFRGMMGLYGYSSGWGLYSILIAAQMVLQIISLPGLFKRQMAGWNFAFYAMIAGVVASLVMGSIGGAIISAVIGLYFLFQIRSYYH